MKQLATLLATLCTLCGQIVLADCNAAEQAFAVEPVSIRVGSVAEFDAAVKQLRPGSELVLAAGEWRDAELRFNAHATPEQPMKPFASH